ncbi:MAG: type II toxin-antitoxin system ParD family antitoxin [Rhizobiaceae bacterium]|nr:type II toxin-antitoxin system ParD family antitoxin [Rhizobiaceae bacterium]
MEDNAISISVSDDEREFIDSQIAAGRYADEQEMLHAGLAALEREQRLRILRELIAEEDADIAPGGVMGFDPAGEIPEHVRDRIDFRQKLQDAGRSGMSSRQIPEILTSVKAKLRANGSL